MIGVMLMMILAPRSSSTVLAQSDSEEGFKILDNSFLLEEAFNQEPGIFQNILGVRHLGGGDWEATFTQEWPLGGQTHQFSYTLPFGATGAGTGFSDALLNYRYQVFTESDARPAVAPRISIILPSGSERKGLGDGVVGLQVNLPFSKRRGDFYLHWNGGITYLPRLDGRGSTGEVAGRPSLASPHLAVSTIWQTRPMFNLMLETVVSFDEIATGGATTRRDTTITLSPGMRGGWNAGTAQWITGAAVPIAFAGDETNAGIFLYLSYELPFKKAVPVRTDPVLLPC